MTDAWVSPRNPLGLGKRTLRERYHAELDDGLVKAWNGALVRFELMARAKRLSGWPLIIARNRWFQRKVVSALAEFPCWDGRPGNLDGFARPHLLCYSYTALEPFRWAKARGWRTVLGQIDPGLAEECVVSELHENRLDLQSCWRPAPEEYWHQWHEECTLADWIIVNSAWSRDALESEGISGDKIRVLPLAYTPPQEVADFRRGHPTAFTLERPLRVLFLGQLNLRKGMGAVVDSVRLLEKEPVQFRFVGPRQVSVPVDIQNSSSVIWTGPVPRGEVGALYRWADVFLFPTFSDGFGLTQLEAQAWKLPVIASPYCGDVVTDGVNGLRLGEISGESIAAALLRLLDEPSLLHSLAQNSGVGPEFSLDALGDSLHKIEIENSTLPVPLSIGDSAKLRFT